MTGNPGMDSEFIKWLSTLGVGGVLAGLMFAFYRKDIKQYTELWRVTAEQLTSVVKENTASNVRVVLLLENIERNSIRKSDIEQLVDRRIAETKDE